MKRILFLSALDFKEKSIQIIKKTPEAFAKAGWDVDYIVMRDNSTNGNYFYEKEINPKNVNVYRFYYPLTNLRSISNRFLLLILNKITSLLIVNILAIKALKLIKKKKYDIIYGYEIHGILAANIIKFFNNKNTKLVSRFQGSFLYEMFEKKQFLRLIYNFDSILAIKLPSDLIIMTNDGTQGDKAIKKIKGNKPYKLCFWYNGVDFLPDVKKSCIKKRKEVILISVSRLVRWKRVDRNLLICHALKYLGFESFIYYIIGDGDQKEYLVNLSKKLNIENHVVFVGAINQFEVFSYLQDADFFLSMYESSNVGNPLLEAIRANKIIVTLANGDTSEWISHFKNGLIYKEDELNFNIIARDILNLINNKQLQNEIKKNIKLIEKKNLWTWEERLSAEISEVEKLIYES